MSCAQEVERNLQDAMQVCRNVLLDPYLLPGGGAVEMAVSHRLTERSRAITGVEQWPYRAVAQALEVIPRTLIQNCGASTIRVLTSLRVRRGGGVAVPGGYTQLLYHYNKYTQLGFLTFEVIKPGSVPGDLLFLHISVDGGLSFIWLEKSKLNANYHYDLIRTHGTSHAMI